MISIAKYIEGVESIYTEQPTYQLGHDGSDGSCDCIGMCKGAIRRAGGDASGLSGTNYAARNTILNLRKFSSASELTVGDVVLKGRQPGDSGYALPDKYKDSGDLTDYYHIGTVTSTEPLVITHMTTPTAKQDFKVGKWAYVGWLPQVSSNPSPSPEPEPQPEPGHLTAVVTAPTGSTVNMRRSPNNKSALVEKVPIGETVDVLERGTEWCKIKWKWYTGYMMTVFLAFDDPPVVGDYTITIYNLTKEEADMLHEEWPNSDISVG